MNFNILGSCVSRDVFNFSSLENSLSLGNYTARSSLISIMSPPIPPEEILKKKLPSKFQQRMVEEDISSRFLKKIESFRQDFLIIDLIDERFDVLYLPKYDSFITLSSELLNSGFEPQKFGRIIKSGSETHRFLWQRSWEQFINVAKEINVLSNILINKVFWGKKLITGENIPGTSEKYTDMNNEYLQWMYSVIENDIPPDNIIETPKEYLVSDLNHQWGAAPFHYSDAYYLRVLENLNQRNCKKIYSPPLLDSSTTEISYTLDSQHPILWLSPESTLESCKIKINFSESVSTADKGLLVQFLFNNEEKIPDNFEILNRSQSPEIGWFSYVTIVPGFFSKELRLIIPPSVSVNRIGIRIWDSTIPKVFIESITIDSL